MFETAALIFSLLGGAFVAYKTSGKSMVADSADVSIDQRKAKIQDQVNRYLQGDIYADFTYRMLHAKVGGANGVPANSLTMKYILVYWAGWVTGYYSYLGDIFQPDIFNRITNGQAGAWPVSDYNIDDFNFPNIAKYTIDEGNDFGLARDTGTWLEENFNISCLAGVLGGAALTIASGGALAAPALIESASLCTID